jgi:hypothetical protein
MNLMISFTSFAILALLWLGFGAALLFNRQILGKAWQSFRRLPLLIQLALALFFLPVVLGLWIWQTSWPVWLRLALVAALAWMTVYTFFPRLPLS